MLEGLGSVSTRLVSAFTSVLLFLLYDGLSVPSVYRVTKPNQIMISWFPRGQKTGPKETFSLSARSCGKDTSWSSLVEKLLLVCKPRAGQEAPADGCRAHAGSHRHARAGKAGEEGLHRSPPHPPTCTALTRSHENLVSQTSVHALAGGRTSSMEVESSVGSLHLEPSLQSDPHR